MPGIVRHGGRSLTVDTSESEPAWLPLLPAPGTDNSDRTELIRLLDRLRDAGVASHSALGFPAIICGPRGEGAPDDDEIAKQRRAWLRTKSFDHELEQTNPELVYPTGLTVDELEAAHAEYDRRRRFWLTTRYTSGRPTRNLWVCSLLAYGSDIFGVSEVELARWAHTPGTEDSTTRDGTRRFRGLSTAVKRGRVVNAALGVWPWAVVDPSTTPKWWTKPDVSDALLGVARTRMELDAQAALDAKRGELALAGVLRMSVDERAADRWHRCLVRVMDLECDIKAGREADGPPSVD